MCWAGLGWAGLGGAGRGGAGRGGAGRGGAGRGGAGRGGAGRGGAGRGGAGRGGTGRDWTGLDWTGLDWTGLDWTGLDLQDQCKMVWLIGILYCTVSPTQSGKYSTVLQVSLRYIHWEFFCSERLQMIYFHHTLHTFAEVFVSFQSYYSNYSGRTCNNNALLLH